MTYPHAPWTLRGYAIATLHLVDIHRVRHLIPKELNIISVFPGKTVGGVYLSAYQSGSVMEYNELIVVPAFLWHHGKFGAWISHIYVDNLDSVAGGRQIWGLPKQMAEFTWEPQRVTVRQKNHLLCSLNYQQQTLAWRQRLIGATFSMLAGELLQFWADFESSFGFVGSLLEVPPDSPFADIGLAQPLLTVRCENMSLKVDAPVVVGQISAEFINR
jgi:hypothetical protein